MPSGARKPGEAASDRRKQILRAAVDVFAERGFHRARVSDIAQRAGVAHGLIYHYFESKDDVLHSVFEENWSVFLKVLRDLRDNPGCSAAAKLRSVAGLLIDALEVAPSIIQVIIQEILRSNRFAHSEKVSAFNEAFSIVRDIVESGQTAGELRPTVDAQVSAYMFFGALETVCTGCMLEAIACGTPQEAARVKATINEVMLRGLSRDPT